MAPRPPSSGDRKRAVNLTLSEDLVAQSRHFTPNLSATVEELLAAYVVDQRAAHEARRRMAQACAAEWNAVIDRVGSFADEHVNL
ncbi:MAG TPA: type II toxin-antitoxin system CcdA family antitoxin [Ramlibacter sp.]|uniref:type II toxin-antitoxin system CcdA family antitoxin n=1 Tax=Ramlibacter sp. TaxID=1917967 RepID=UPI002B7CD9F6|nr:type II toxin-antitoxin system CcdA family antitoxin [Ramlibacter sp.]HVZ45117.1 type II toxin-antitoxin system CcdA family antitoxin [Ramlibacter sp.]